MNSLYPQNLLAYTDIFLVFLRLFGFFLLVPGFSHTAIPISVKTTLVLSLTLATYPLVRPWLTPMSMDLWALSFVAVKELSIGCMMGFAAYLTFEAINLAAQFIGYQMGFGTAGLVDPQNHAHVSIMVPFQGWLALMVFFFTDMHHQMIQLWLQSFQLTHGFSGDVVVSAALLKVVTELTSQLFVLAVQMAAPFTFLVLACNVGIGILSRLLPQMNILLFSFPITIMLSFFAFYLMAPETLDYLELRLAEMSTNIVTVLKSI